MDFAEDRRTAIKCPICKGGGMFSPPVHANIGERISWLRRLRGLKQKDLAELVGKSKATIASIEGGKLDLSINQLGTYAGALGVKPKSLIMGIEFRDSSDEEPQVAQRERELELA